MDIRNERLSRFLRDPNNPRSNLLPDRLAAMVISVKTHGVKVPLIGYELVNQIMLVDGHYRLEAAQLAGLDELPVIVFPEKPDDVDVLITQLTINGHREGLNPVDEFEAFTKVATRKNWTATELAKGLAVDSAEVTRVMSIRKLSEEERKLVRDGKISKSAAYALSRLPAEKRAELVSKAAAGEVTRDQLNNHVRRRKKSDEVKIKRVNCPVTGGNVCVQTKKPINLDNLIEMLEDLTRSLRKARTQSLDVSTAVLVLRDRQHAQDACAGRAQMPSLV